MSRAKDRASRLREFRDTDDEYRETESKEAAARRFQAMRTKDVRPSDFQHASEELRDRMHRLVRDGKELLREMQMDDWKKE